MKLTLTIYQSYNVLHQNVCTKMSWVWLLPRPAPKQNKAALCIPYFNLLWNRSLNQIRFSDFIQFFIRFFPIFRLFPTFRLADSTALVSSYIYYFQRWSGAHLLCQLPSLPFFLSKFQHRSEEEMKMLMVNGSEERSRRLSIAPWATVGQFLLLTYWSCSTHTTWVLPF